MSEIDGERFAVEGIHRDVTSGEEKEPCVDMSVVREKHYDLYLKK